MTAEFYINYLQLLPHPEGGYYRETYKSAELIDGHSLPARFSASRYFSTAIYYLLQQGDFSAFHRIKSDECWHFYAGETLLIHVIEPGGNYSCTRLGNEADKGETFQFVVAAGAWFSSEPAEDSKYSLAGCTVAPGFDFADFEMADKKNLTSVYPYHKSIIDRLCK